MKLEHLEVREILRKKEITHLYHANTTKTACTFITQGGLLSRGAVEKYNLDQTPQSSDKEDKEYNVWNDIFLDSIDLHTKFRQQNHYGPILFKYNLNLLNRVYDLPLWVTKNNPIYWNANQTNEERYMSGIEEFEEMYVNGSYREMITFRNTFYVLPFIPYLEEIIIDDPKLEWSVSKENLFENSYNAIQKAMKLSSVDYSRVKIIRRECNNCSCRDKYIRLPKMELLKKFSL